MSGYLTISQETKKALLTKFLNRVVRSDPFSSQRLIATSISSVLGLNGSFGCFEGSVQQTWTSSPFAGPVSALWRTIWLVGCWLILLWTFEGVGYYETWDSWWLKSVEWRTFPVCVVVLGFILLSSSCGLPYYFNYLPNLSIDVLVFQFVCCSSLGVVY